MLNRLLYILYNVLGKKLATKLFTNGGMASFTLPRKLGNLIHAPTMICPDYFMFRLGYQDGWLRKQQIILQVVLFEECNSCWLE